MGKGLNIDRRLNPCKAGSSMNACSTARGANYCGGCGRSKEQVDNWLTYTDKEKIEIMEAIHTRTIVVRGFPT